MFRRKDSVRVKLSGEELRILCRSLMELRNRLLREGRYTDAVDEIILKLCRD